MQKISMKSKEGNSSIKEVYERFIKATIAKGVSEKTVSTYRNHFNCLSHHLDSTILFDDLSNDIVNEMITSMRESGLAFNSVVSYTRVLRTFFNWCDGEGLRVPNESSPYLKCWQCR